MRPISQCRRLNLPLPQAFQRATAAVATASRIRLLYFEAATHKSSLASRSARRESVVRGDSSAARRALDTAPLPSPQPLLCEI